MLRYLTAGESHGPALVATLEGMPAGVPVTSKTIATDLARRRLGHGRGARMRFEQDEIEVLGGIRHGYTLGSPVAVVVRNSEWPKWEDIMSPDPVAGGARTTGRGAPLTRPRPGHADLAGMQKYGFDDVRPILERASARETAARVAVGAVARAFLAELGITVLSHVTRLGDAAVGGEALLPGPDDLDAVDASPVRCLDPDAAARMVAAVDAARDAKDTLGGVFEVVVYGLPPGLGSHVHWDRRLDARLAAALMGIQAIKGVEVGDGFESAGLPGSAAHDEIFPAAPPGPGGRVPGPGAGPGAVPGGLPRRRTNRSGGVEGGMTTGEPLRVRAAMKPLSTLMQPLDTVDTDTGEPAHAVVQRSDVTAVPAAGVVGEAVVALTVADVLLAKTGGDSLVEVRRNLTGYLDHLS